MRPKYKEKYLDMENQFVWCKDKLDDCRKFIIEAKRFLREKNLNHEFDNILNEKYGWSLEGAIVYEPEV